MLAFSLDQCYVSVQINSNHCSARTFGNSTVDNREKLNTIGDKASFATARGIHPIQVFLHERL